MTVTWTVRVVGGWLRRRGGDWRSKYEEADRRFGMWTYSVSHGSSYELSRKVESYLKGRGVDTLDIFEVLCFFCLTVVHGTEYDERIYRVLKKR